MRFKIGVTVKMPLKLFHQQQYEDEQILFKKEIVSKLDPDPGSFNGLFVKMQHQFYAVIVSQCSRVCPGH